MREAWLGLGTPPATGGDSEGSFRRASQERRLDTTACFAFPALEKQDHGQLGDVGVQGA